MPDRKYQKRENRTNNLNGNTSNSSKNKIMRKTTTLLEITKKTVMRTIL